MRAAFLGVMAPQANPIVTVTATAKPKAKAKAKSDPQVNDSNEHILR